MKSEERVLGMLNAQPDCYYTLSGKLLLETDKIIRDQYELIKKQGLIIKKQQFIIKILQENQKKYSREDSNEI